MIIRGILKYLFNIFFKREKCKRTRGNAILIQVNLCSVVFGPFAISHSLISTNNYTKPRLKVCIFLWVNMKISHYILSGNSKLSLYFIVIDICLYPY